MRGARMPTRQVGRSRSTRHDSELDDGDVSDDPGAGAAAADGDGDDGGSDDYNGGRPLLMQLLVGSCW